MKSVLTIVGGLLGLATLTLLVSPKAQTVPVLGSIFTGTEKILGILTLQG